MRYFKPTYPINNHFFITHTYYYILFKYIEPLLLLSSIIIFILYNEWTTNTLFQPFVNLIDSHVLSIDILHHNLTYLLIGMFFNMTLIVCGIQHVLIDQLDSAQLNWFVFVLLYGDIGHFMFTYIYVFASHKHNNQSYGISQWELGVWLNIGITLVLFGSRIVFYIHQYLYNKHRSKKNR